uniref:Uncharacterized protein n=1 Tax=Neobodo designis TaxID=312471 RepID=A0A7S1M320_NEODS|mmetsp:Transcript_33269/g.102741  ORF Transcript_33269/g.102741 Transcript_33269/m.102741 type:complete len:273 (+) Transcript_33269:44-862(+)
MRSFALVVALVALAWNAPGTDAIGRVNGVGYNVRRPSLDSPAHPYKGRIENTEVIAPKGIREARLECDRTGHVNRIIMCEIHTFDLCGNEEGEQGNQTQWTYRVESVTGQDTSALVAPIVWVKTGVARFYFTPIHKGLYNVNVWRARGQVSLPLLTTPPQMKQLVEVHESIITCTNYLINGPPRPTQTFLWAQSSRDNERKPIYGIEPATSDKTNVFADIAKAYGAGVPTGLHSRTGRDAIKGFRVGDLGELPRVDNSAFRFCDYLQRSMGD